MIKPNSLFTNAVWNIFTVSITAIAGFILVPILLKGIGTENFGIYSIILMIGGFAALQSLGLGEATLKYVSEFFSKKDIEGINRVLGATLTVYIFSGLVVSGLIIIFATILINWFNLSPENVENAIFALRIAGFAFLIGIFSSALRTIPEATQRYDILSKYNLAMMVLRYSTMYLIAINGGGIVGLTFLILGTAIVDVFIYFLLAKKLIPGIKCFPSFNKNAVREVFSYGIFSFINDIIQKASAYIDQFVLGVFFTASSVAYLTAPKDLITKAQGLTGAAGQALFPRFSSMVEGDEMQNLYSISLWILTVFSIIIFIPLAIIIPSFLTKWLTPEFAENSKTFARLFCLGVAFNGGTSAYFALLKGTGRIKLLTKFIMSIQLSAVIFTGILVYEFGIIGSGIRVLFFSFIGITICIYVGKKVFFKFPVRKMVIEVAFLPIALSIACYFLGTFLLGIFPITSWLEIFVVYTLFLVFILSVQFFFNYMIYKRDGVALVAFYYIKNYFLQIIPKFIAKG